METQKAASGPSESERLAQEQSFKLRDLRKKQAEEVEAMTAKHERDMKGLDSAYQVELTAKKDDYERKLNELNDSQTLRIANVMKQGEMNVKQAQETYRLQADEMASRGEKKLNALREQEAAASENINRKKAKGNA